MTLQLKLADHTMRADQNPYAAPQTLLILAPSQPPVVSKRARFPGTLVRQGIRNGFAAGVFASLVMLFLFLLRHFYGSDSEFSHLLIICGWFLLATSLLGLFWGFNHEIIVWCLRREHPER